VLEHVSLTLSEWRLNVAAASGGAPSLGGDPTSTVLGLVVMLIIIGVVVWKMAL
jgi:hypothetical protein